MATLHRALIRRPAGEDARARLLSGLPVTDRRLQSAGVSTVVLEGGDGPPIVLLAGEFAAVWMRVIPELVATHHVRPSGGIRGSAAHRARKRGRES